jgi:serine/threonine protein kinase
MSYCFNPCCHEPLGDPWTAELCSSCGSPLVLRGRYRMRRLLGEGGFGRTYLAADLQATRDVAVKQIPLVDRERSELLTREAQLLRELHEEPGIPQLVDCFNDGEFLYIVQDYIEGWTLQDLLDQQGSVPLDQATRLLRCLAGTLAALHSRGIIHRDVKPSNIILPPYNAPPVLIDFGVAKRGSSGSSRTFGALAGTRGFIAPEAYRGVDVPSRDLYALAQTILVALGPNPPGSLGPLLDRMRAAEPEGRIRTAYEVLDALDHLPDNALAEIPIPPGTHRMSSAPTYAVAPAMVIDREAPRPRTVPVWLIALVGGTLLLTAAGIGWYAAGNGAFPHFGAGAPTKTPTPETPPREVAAPPVVSAPSPAPVTTTRPVAPLTPAPQTPTPSTPAAPRVIEEPPSAAPRIGNVAAWQQVNAASFGLAFEMPSLPRVDERDDRAAYELLFEGYERLEYRVKVWREDRSFLPDREADNVEEVEETMEDHDPKRILTRTEVTRQEREGRTFYEMRKTGLSDKGAKVVRVVLMPTVKVVMIIEGSPDIVQRDADRFFSSLQLP